MPDGLATPGWLDALDIALVAGFLWAAIRYVRSTRARPALVGLALIALVYLTARFLELELTASILRGFFAALVLVLVVVFQDDLRRLFEQLGSWWRGRDVQPAGTETLDLLIRVVSRLAESRTGALIVLPGREPLERHTEGGILLRGRVSEPLLLSLFDASSPGHDGAVILNHQIVERFAVHLPLSANHDALGPRGTRHAAALGLAERSDAICIAVSEERGTVSVARNGEIRTLARPAELSLELERALGVEAKSVRWWHGRAGLDAALAVIAAFVLWMILIPGSDVDEATVTAAVTVSNLPPDLELESVEPSTLEVTLRGLRRDLMLAQRGEISIRIDAYLARLGRRTFAISAQDVRRPDAVSVVGVAPDRVRLSLRAATSEEGEIRR